MSNRLVIIGAGGHGKVAADIAELNNYNDIIFLDDVSKNESVLGHKVAGRISLCKEYRDYDFFVAVGNAAFREKMLAALELADFKIATLIHPGATIAKSVSIGEGTIIAAGAVVNPDTKIGKGSIINTGATVDHDNVIDDFVHISVGAHLAGTVKIGKSTWIGIGAVVSNGINICPGCMIGAGAVVIKNISEPGTYIGVPAKLK